MSYNIFQYKFNVLLFGSQAQAESENTSKRTKKAYDKGFSYKGHKWGNKFKGTIDHPKLNSKGKVDVSEKELKAIRRRIIWLKNNNYSLQEIQNDLAKRFKIVPSFTYISGVKS